MKVMRGDNSKVMLGLGSQLEVHSRV